MKHLKFSPKFKKAYKVVVKLYSSKNIKEEIITTLDLLQKDHNNENLRNHELRESLKRRRSISVNADIRIIFIEKEDCYLLLDIGRHKTVYR